MKNKYMRLSKKERKEEIKEYCESDTSREGIYKRLRRLKFIGIFGIVYAVFSFCLDFFMDTINIWDYVLDGLLLIFCLIFVIKANDLIIKQVNNYLIDKKNNSKKSKEK